MIKKLLANKKIRFVILGLSTLGFIGLLVLIIVFSQRKLLIINVEPTDSIVYLDNKLIHGGFSRQRVKTGEHTISATKSGYLQELRTFRTDKKTTINIKLSLIPTVRVTKTLDTGLIYSYTPSDSTTAYAINPATNGLVKINVQTGETSPFNLPGVNSVNSFRVYKDKMIIETEAFPSTKPHQYFLLNLTTGNLMLLKLGSFTPVISLNLLPDLDTLVVQGNYVGQGDLVDILTSEEPYQDFRTIKEKVPRGLILPLFQNQILIVNSIDAPNADTADVLDLVTGQTRAFVSRPNFIKDPTTNPGGNIVTYITNVGLISKNIKTNETKIHIPDVNSEDVFFWWEDDNLLYILNKSQKNIQRIDYEANSISNEISLPGLENLVIVEVQVFENRLIIISFNDVGGLQINYFDISS